MVQSVQRALTLLELLDAGGNEGRALAELSVDSGLKAPTAHNLLATLVALGYAQQVPGSRHYALGERARSLGKGRAAVARLRQAAAGPVSDLQAEVNETVILAVDLDERRHSILSCESAHELRVTAATGVDDHFCDTATGRMLLALRTPQDALALVTRQGLPGPAWPGVANPAALARLLAGIRRAGFAEFARPASHVRALAVAVPLRQTSLPAALGLFYPTVRDRKGRREDLLKRLRRAASIIADAYERT
jgi:DNA-binding IclR family transcriptional regulator